MPPYLAAHARTGKNRCRCRRHLDNIALPLSRVAQDFARTAVNSRKKSFGNDSGVGEFASAIVLAIKSELP